MNYINDITKYFFFHVSSHGKALLNLGEFEKAMKQLRIAHSLQPDNDAIKKAIQKVS